MSTFKISLNIVSTITKACIRHLLKILFLFGNIDLNWNQVLIGQHLDPWPISYALLIKAQCLCLFSPSRCSTWNSCSLLKHTPISCMLITLLWLCSHSTSRQKVSKYGLEIPQSQTADNPMAPRGRPAQPSWDTRKTNKAKQSALSSPSRWLQ